MIPIPHPQFAFGDLPKRLKESGDEVKVPRELLERLLDLYISLWDFDEDWYLEKYPDIQTAVTEGRFRSGWAHFRAIGYLEGRIGRPATVDSEWYMSTYPDIAQAILEGKVNSALEHYEQFGYAEGRLPTKPDIHAKWYMARYIADPHGAKPSALADDFHQRGYRQLAIPVPPR